MVRRPSTLILSVMLALPAVAIIDPKVAEFCLKAHDFQGCVKSMSGDSSGSTTTIRQIQQKGADIAEGNQCPSGFAYIGGGNCRNVICSAGTGRGHDYRLAGKGWECKKTLGIFGEELELDGEIVRASFNKSCPDGEPGIGFNSTCHSYGNSFNDSTGLEEFYKVRERNKGKSLLEKIEGCREEDINRMKPFSESYYDCMRQAEELKRQRTYW